MDGKSKSQLSEHLRELQLKLKALDTLMVSNATERVGVPNSALIKSNYSYERIRTTNYQKSLLN